MLIVFSYQKVICYQSRSVLLDIRVHGAPFILVAASSLQGSSSSLLPLLPAPTTLGQFPSFLKHYQIAFFPNIIFYRLLGNFNSCIPMTLTSLYPLTTSPSLPQLLVASPLNQTAFPVSALPCGEAHFSILIPGLTFLFNGFLFRLVWWLFFVLGFGCIQGLSTEHP